MKTASLLAFIPLIFAVLATPAFAKHQIAVIAAPGSHFSAMTATEAKSYFLGEEDFLPSGEKVLPVDHLKTAQVAREFYAAVAGMTIKDLSVHWAKRVFAGRGTPPAQVESDDRVKDWVKAKPGGIGYIYSEAVDASVKVLVLLDVD